MAEVLWRESVGSSNLEKRLEDYIAVAVRTVSAGQETNLKSQHSGD